VVEDPAGLNYTTTYAYDEMDNLITVSQGAQQRSFAYDSLGRLICASNPENRAASAPSCLTTPLPTAGLLRYEYDGNGNLTRRTDARGVVAQYAYDNLNRMTLKQYTEAGLPADQKTPNVTYCYDGRTAAARERAKRYRWGA
jgi:YD repeat-containing protein